MPRLTGKMSCTVCGKRLNNTDIDHGGNAQSVCCSDAVYNDGSFKAPVCIACCQRSHGTANRVKFGIPEPASRVKQQSPVVEGHNLGRDESIDGRREQLWPLLYGGGTAPSNLDAIEALIELADGMLFRFAPATVPCGREGPQPETSDELVAEVRAFVCAAKDLKEATC